jgi:hypothetical protein
MVDDDVEVPAVDVVLADQAGIIGLLHGRLKVLALADELAANIDIGDMRAHGAAGEQAALDQMVRIVPQDLAVLAGAGLGLVGIDEELARAAVVDALLGHEGPLERRRETGAAAAAQARALDLVDDPVATVVDELLGVHPAAASACPFEAPVAVAVEIGEDAIFVFKHIDLLRALARQHEKEPEQHAQCSASDGESQLSPNHHRQQPGDQCQRHDDEYRAHH